MTHCTECMYARELQERLKTVTANRDTWRELANELEASIKEHVGRVEGERDAARAEAQRMRDEHQKWLNTGNRVVREKVAQADALAKLVGDLRQVLECADTAMETAALHGVERVLAPTYRETWAWVSQRSPRGACRWQGAEYMTNYEGMPITARQLLGRCANGFERDPAARPTASAQLAGPTKREPEVTCPRCLRKLKAADAKGQGAKEGGGE